MVNEGMHSMLAGFVRLKDAREPEGVFSATEPARAPATPPLRLVRVPAGRAPPYPGDPCRPARPPAVAAAAERARLPAFSRPPPRPGASAPAPAQVISWRRNADAVRGRGNCSFWDSPNSRRPTCGGATSRPLQCPHASVCFGRTFSLWRVSRLRETRRDLAKFWISVRWQVGHGRIEALLRLDRIALNALREIRLASGFFIELVTARASVRQDPD